MENPECKTPSSNVDEKDQEKKRSPFRSPRLCEENYPPKNMDLQMEIKEHELCNVKLSAKEREINRLKGIIDRISKQLEDKKFTYEREQSKRFDLQRQVKKLKDQLFKANSNLKKEREKTERLTHQNQEKDDKHTDMRLKCMRLQKGINEFKQMHEVSAEREKKIVEQHSELEKMCTKMGKFKKANDSISEKNDKLEDRIRKLQTKLDHLERVGETHQLCVEIQDRQSRYIKELECEVESKDNNFLLLQDEYDNLNCSYNTMKAEVAKVKHLQSELDAKTEEVNKLTRQQIRAESLSLEVKILEREKANVEEENSELTRAFQTKGIEMESLIKHRERSEKQIRNLNNEISDIQKSKSHTVNESLQQLLTENSALKSTLEHRKLEIEILSKECEKQRRTREKGEHEITELEQVVQKKKNEMAELNTMLEEFSKKCSASDRDKKEARAIISALTDALNEKKRDVESLTSQLERAEENVSILSQDINDIQDSKRPIAEEKLQSLQTENSSLKSALSKATNEIEDLLNKRTNLQKYKTDAEHKTSTLMNALKEKKTEIEALRDQLARSEKSVSILSKDIKDIQGSKRQAADEKVQGLMTENASLNLELVEATTEIDALRNKCTNLQKYKTDTEHTINTLLNAAKEKENESESLNKQLARKNNELSKDVSYLKKEKEHAENQRNRLSKALDEKEKEIEVIRNDITRSEEKVSELSKEITDIKVSKRQTADEKLQDFQAENASLRSALSKSTIQIEELSYKCTNLQKYRTDTEHKLSKLLNAEEEKENEIKSLNADLARIKDMSLENKDPEMDLENAEHKTDKLSKTVQDKEEKLETLVELKEKADDNVTSTGIL